MKLVFSPYNNEKYKLAFRDFGEADVSIKSVDSISVLWRSWGDLPGCSPLNRPYLGTDFLYII
jgi:hypothetical protein